jgi:N-acyl-D-aspartate/D-glutamate deacylase
MLGSLQLNELEDAVTYDVIIRDGSWFDGTGSAPRTRSLGIRDGVVAAVSAGPLDATGCPEVIDAAGKWIMPGFIDVHTHYDAEVLLDPGLRESVRHGVTTVLLGNCSLSTVYANSEDAADLFSRVEAVPREYVYGALNSNRTWSTAAEYIDAIDALPLGPNVASLLGHSDLRTAVLGLDRATDGTAKPSDAELEKMAALLDEALEAGVLGMSGMDAAIDKLDGDRFRSRALPSTFATWRERRRLIKVLRKRGRMLQSAPDVENPASALMFFLTSSRMLGRRNGVRMSLLVSADAKSMPFAVHVFGFGTRVLNALLGSSVRFQHLPVPFELYSDGVDLPVFEEFGAGTAALHLRDQLERNELLADKSYRRRFRREFDRRKLGPSLWHRDFHDAMIVECPDKSLIGKSFGTIAEERGLHPLDAFLDVLVENGERNVRWTTIVANHRPKQLNKLAADSSVHMGFSDAGAHLRNMAFYNFGVRMLKRTRDAYRAGAPFLSTERAVHRLTGELAEWFGIDAGTLREGDRADFVVIDPAGLNESVDGYYEEEVPFYGGLRRMVNRNDEAVVATGINGAVVFCKGQFRDGYGQSVKSGRYLRAVARPKQQTQQPASVSA